MIWLLSSLIVFGIAYDWLATWWLHRWLTSPIPISTSNAHASVTFFRPIKRNVPELEIHLRDFLSSVQPDDQILFGVYADDLPSQQIIRKTLAAFPRHDIQLIPCLPDLARNPKINKLLQLTPCARHDHWIILDSEIENAADLLPIFRREWAALDFPVLSAPYRFRRLSFLTTPVLHTLLPGLAVLHNFGKINHTLGACVAVTRQQIDRLGGWSTLGDELAEDYQLGHRLAALGQPIAYSRAIVQIANDPAPSTVDYFRTLHRQTATYRHCQPWGFAGSIAIHCLFWALLTAFFLPATLFSTVALLVGTSRIVVCHLRARTVCWPLPFWKSLFLIPGSSLLATFFWLLAWFPLPIHWAGNKWET